MGYEVEQKYRVEEPEALRRKLADRGAEASPTVDHDDLYLAHPSRDFAQTGEALRVRSEGNINRVTYKGGKLGGPVKTREEIEVAFAEGPDRRGEVVAIFERLGFRPVLSVRKRRAEYHLAAEDGRKLSVTIDEAEGLGWFAEVETMADDRDGLDEAHALVERVARELGLSSVEPRSYLRMMLESRGMMPRNPPGQT